MREHISKGFSTKRFSDALGVFIILLFIQSEQLKAKDTVDINVIPKVEFYFDQQQFGDENSFSFQLNHIQDFYSLNLQKILSDSQKDIKANSTDEQNPQNNNSTQSIDRSDYINDPECSLNIEGGDFEPVENFEIYQNIISNVLQISRNDNEYYYFYLDTQLQLYTYRVNTKKETLKYLGHKKIEFEDFILNSTDPNSPMTILFNNNNNNNNNQNGSKPNTLLRRNLQLAEGDNNLFIEKEKYNEFKNFEDQTNDQLHQLNENGEILKRNLADDPQEPRGQYITFLKLLQWKDQIICVLNSSLYVIVQDKAYKIIKFDSLMDIDAIDDFLFVAMGNEGLKVFEFWQGIGGSSQPIKDIQLKKIAFIKWKDIYVRQVHVIKDRIYFLNKDSIYIYLLSGKSVNFGCMINDSEVPPNRVIDRIQAYENTIIVLTSSKNATDEKNFDPKLKLKGYQEYSLNKEILSTNVPNGSGSNGNFNNQGFCFYKVKEENDLPNGIRDIQIDNNFMFFGLENGIRGIKLGIQKQYLNDITKNKWTNNFIPNVSHFKKIEDTSYLIVASGNRFSLFNFSEFSLNLICSTQKIFDNGNLVTYNGEKAIHSSSIEYQIFYVTDQCTQELEKIDGDVSQDTIDFNIFKQYFGYGSQIRYEDIFFLNTKDNSTCVISQTIALKQITSNFAKSHGFMIGMVCALTGGALVFFLANYFYKSKQKDSKDVKTPQKMKKRLAKMNSNAKSTDDSALFNATSMQKSSSIKKENINNNSSTCILSQTKSTKNQSSSVLEDENNHNNQSNNDYSYNQNYFPKNKKEEKQSAQTSIQQQQKQLDEQTQQMLYLSQQEQQQFIQQILQNQQFQQLSKYEQDRFLQHQYQQHLEYQRQIRLQQMKQQQQINQQMQRGGKHKGISPIQRKYGGGVDPILETDSDKKMSTRRDQEAFYRMKKRNNHFEENLIRSYQKNINVINDLNLNIQLEDNSQPPNHNVFSPQNLGKVEIDYENDHGDVDEVLTNNHHKQQYEIEIEQQQQQLYPKEGESIPTDNQQIQNPKIPFMTLQSIQNSLKQQKQTTKSKTPKKTKLLSQSKQYQEYEDDSDAEEDNEEIHKEKLSSSSSKKSQQQFQEDGIGSSQQIQQVSNNESESNNQEDANLKQQYSQKSSGDKEKHSIESELKTSESQAISDKMTRSNNETTSTSSNRQQNIGKENKKQEKVKSKNKKSQKEDELNNQEKEGEDSYHNTLNDNESHQDEAQLNNNHSEIH